MARKKKAPVPIIPETPPDVVIRHKSPHGYVVVVCGSLDPEDRDRTVTDEENLARNPNLLPADHLPLYSIRGKDWPDCMKHFNEVEGFGPYKPMEDCSHVG